MFTVLLLLAQTTGYPECNQAAADQGIQQEMNICAHGEFLEADAALNAQWRITRDAMKANDAQLIERSGPDGDGRPGYFETLLEAQRAWIIYRDAHCRSEGNWARGGSIVPLLVSSCKTALTEARTKQLQDLVEYP